MKKVKRLCLVRRGASPRPIDDPIYFDEEGDYAWVRIADVTASERYLEATTQTLSSLGKSKSVALEPGELFLSIAATVGKPIITKIKCCIHDGFVYFVGLRENREYLYYLFSCGEPYKGLGKLGTQLNLNTDTIGDIYLPVPPHGEQQRIVQVLDRETAKIDALVAKNERLIELLQEQRTALIARAVTKGLDPTVPMRESGVEWLGEIPTHWELVALKRRTKRIQTGATPPTSQTGYYEDGAIAWYGPGSFANDLPLQAPIKFISESAVKDGVARVFEAGSAVIVTIGATIGKVAYMEQAGSSNQQITGVTFDLRHIFGKFGAYQLKRLEPVLRGIAPNTTLPILDQEEVGYLPFVVPPKVEQRAIAAFLDRETARIDALAAKVRDAIDRLNELRTALISAAVTGKIDVREEAA